MSKTKTKIKGVNSYPFSFSDYRINKTNITISQGSVDEMSKDMSIGIDVEVFKKGTEFTVKLGAIISNKDNSINIESFITGYFACDDDAYLDKSAEFMTAEAPLMLFNYLRSHISTVSASSNIPSIIMPIINPNEFKKRLKDSEIQD